MSTPRSAPLSFHDFILSSVVEGIGCQGLGIPGPSAISRGRTGYSRSFRGRIILSGQWHPGSSCKNRIIDSLCTSQPLSSSNDDRTKSWSSHCWSAHDNILELGPESHADSEGRYQNPNRATRRHIWIPVWVFGSSLSSPTTSPAVEAPEVALSLAPGNPTEPVSAPKPRGPWPRICQGCKHRTQSRTM